MPKDSFRCGFQRLLKKFSKIKYKKITVDHGKPEVDRGKLEVNQSTIFWDLPKDVWFIIFHYSHENFYAYALVCKKFYEITLIPQLINEQIKYLKWKKLFDYYKNLLDVPKIESVRLGFISNAEKHIDHLIKKPFAKKIFDSLIKTNTYIYASLAFYKNAKILDTENTTIFIENFYERHNYRIFKYYASLYTKSDLRNLPIYYVNKFCEAYQNYEIFENVQLIKKMVENDSRNFKYLPKEYWCEEIIMIALEEHLDNFKLIPKTKMKQVYCDFVVRKNTKYFRLIPNEFKTTEMCQLILSKDLSMVEYIPD